MRSCNIYLVVVLLCNPSWGFIGIHRAKSSFPKYSTVEPEIVDALDIMPDFFAMEDTMYQNLQAKTEPLIAFDQYPLGKLPESVCDNSLLLLNSWARTASPTGASTAASILERLEREMELGNPEIKLSVMHYSIVAHAWAKSNHHQAGWHAEQILHQMDKRSKAYPHLVPNRVVMNCVIHAWSRQGNIERSEAIFHRMKTDPSIEIEVGDYNALLSAYARQGNARKAESILKEMLESNIRPDIISYNCVLDSWKQVDETGAAERAEVILETLQKNYDDGESNIRPNGRSYSSVASAYIKSGREDSVAQAERLLSLAEQRGLSNDSYLYNSVLDAWAMSNHVDAAQKAESILHDMEKAGNINTVSYNTVIKAWKRSTRKDAATCAEALLNRMENLHRNDYTLNVGPDVYTYTSVIQCYTKTNTPQSASKAVALFTRMIDACRAGNENLKPNTITLNVVLDALAKTGDPRSAEKAEEILTMFRVSCESCLDNVNLNTVSFTTVIDAYAKSGLQNAAKKAEKIFEAMEMEYSSGNKEAKPNTRSFNTLMNAWVQTGANGGVQRAEALLEKMEALYQRGNEDVRPDVVSFSIVMNG
jgi:pentatricopeptide repeat protein